MRPSRLVFAGALFLLLGCGGGPTEPRVPAPEPPPKPDPPNTGMVSHAPVTPAPIR